MEAGARAEVMEAGAEAIEAGQDVTGAQNQWNRSMSRSN
jgi:hypothetical protein